MNPIKNEKGYVTVLFALLLPVILMFAGIILDGSRLLERQSHLMASVKYAALSATSEYTVNEGSLAVNEREAKAKATAVLKRNSSQAVLTKFKVEGGNQCIVEAEVKVQLYFMKLFGVESKVLKAEYTASRSLKH